MEQNSETNFLDIFMNLSLEQRKLAFIEVGHALDAILASESADLLTPAGKKLQEEIYDARNNNPWFTSEIVKSALKGVREMLHVHILDQWLNGYSFATNYETPPKTIAVIMAGNIPLVGFHDMLCVLLSGNRLLGKLSSQDKYLPVKFSELLLEIEPAFNGMISLSEGIISGFDAVIATGSNNSSRYFEYYFGKYPHIIRKNRNSIAILSGKESKAELLAIADDIFMYYGMGCRNVSKVLVPKDYDFTGLLDAFQKWSFLQDHHKYINNYEYQKAILLVNCISHLDAGFSLVVKDERIASPLSVVYYDEYTDMEQVELDLKTVSDELQCVVIPPGVDLTLPGMVRPGNTQMPGPTDYADGIDTLSFLLNTE
jgi:hypothetical protein